MGIGASFVMIAIGAILTWAVNAHISGVNVHALGIILMLLGLLSFLLSLVFWRSWGGFGTVGGRTVVREDYGVAAPRRVVRRRAVVEEAPAVVERDVYDPPL